MKTYKKWIQILIGLACFGIFASAAQAYSLTVTTSGSGTVTSVPAGINCGAGGTVCTAQFTNDSMVQLIATPAAGYTLGSWNGACWDSGACQVEMYANRAVSAAFVAAPTTNYTLTVTKTGSGTVTSAPSGVNCGTTCSASYASGTSVTLTATPASGYSFTGWGGACSGTGTCGVTMAAARTVTATFTATTVNYTLSVTKTGSGTVTSAPSGINCGTTCSASYASGTSVTLTAAPASGYSFTGWGGACSGTGTCGVTMAAARSVTATFTATTTNYTLTVTKTGFGTVTSAPSGINCGATCSASYASGTSVTLTAAPASGYSFTGWGGACSGTGTCGVTMAAAQTVTATFVVSPVATYSLQVTIGGSGAVSSIPVGIVCGAVCTSNFDAGTGVTLTATASTGFTFAGWSGSCTGTAATCSVAMTAARAVTATFTQNTASGTVYYVSNSGSNSNNGTSLTTPFLTVAKAVSVVNPGDIVEVRAGTYNESLVVSRPGSATAGIILRGYNGERPVIRGTGSGATIYFYHNNCDEDAIGNGSGNTDCQPMYWTVQGLEVRGSASGGGDGNVIKIDTPKVRIQGNRLCCSSADIVKLVRTSNDVEILDNEIWQDPAITVPSGNAQGIDIVGADRTRVAGNYVHDVPDIAMYAKGNARNTVFENNLLVNIGGPDNGHALMLGQSTDAERMVDGPYESYDGIIRNNVVVNATWACLATASSYNVRIYNNSCYNTGTSTHASIFLSNEAEQPQGGLNIEIANNIIYGSPARPLIKINANSMSNFSTLAISNNLYFVLGGGVPTFQPNANNGAISFSQWPAAYTALTGRTDNSRVLDPLFVGTTGTTPLMLQATSPAIDAGVNTGAVPADRLGIARPQGGATDIGAYEFTTASTFLGLVAGKTGAGSGTVSSNPAGIDCGTTCSASFAAGTAVTLTATPSAGSSFTGWSGDCSGAAACIASMSQARSVSANFALATGGGTPFTVDSATPANGASGVALNSAVTVAFQSAVNCATVTPASFSVAGVSGSLSCSNATAIFTPSAALANGTTYTVQLTADVRSATGTALTPTSWSFSTVSGSPSAAKFSFMVYGDSRAERITADHNGCQDNVVHIGLVKRMSEEAGTSFVVHVGDMVSGFVGSTTNWVERGDCPNTASNGSLKEIIAPLQGKAPAAGLQTFFFPTVGNHDDAWLDGNSYPDKFGHGFCDVFNPKALGSVNHTQQSYFQDTTHASLRYTDAEFDRRMCSKNVNERGVYSDYMYYSFDFQGAHFVVMRLNSDYYNLLENNGCGTQQEANYDCWYNKHQLDWLRHDLAKARNNSPDGPIFVFLHAPLVGSSDGHAANASWPALLPEFSKYKVKAVFSGHSHVYERSHPVFSTPANTAGVRDDVNGTTYFVSGGGGSSLAGFNATLDPRTAFVSNGSGGTEQSRGYHYLRVDVDGAQIKATAIGLDGTKFDTVTLP